MIWHKLTQQPRSLKRETHALYFAYRDPRTPWYARIIVACVVAYAFSPIDLIPDFVPILGYLDDLILLPLGIALALRLIPADILRASRERATQADQRPTDWRAALVIVAIWISLTVLGLRWLLHHLR